VYFETVQLNFCSPISEAVNGKVEVFKVHADDRAGNAQSISRRLNSRNFDAKLDYNFL
jgi:hypothetical protein